MEFKNNFINAAEMPQDSCGATKYIVEILLNKIHPMVLLIHNKLNMHGIEHEISKIQDVFALCCNQIKKCVLSLFDVFRLEHNQGILLQETRQCNIERLQWCIDRLDYLNHHLQNVIGKVSENDDTGNDSINVSTMYFVNWIDHTFEVLNKLSDVIYKTDYKDNDGIYQIWKNDMIECVTELHGAVDELLLSAMTICRYCLPGDQHIIKARCQVVLRETKALLSELVDGGLGAAVKATVHSLKLPIMPSNVNVLIDVLKDVLYVLETNTNTALLALLIHCFSNNSSSIHTLRDHFSKSAKGTCTCIVKSDYDVTEDCAFVKEFDLYNERLLQIGSFAVSCSSDQNRILSLRSGLASLEGLDPHLVPALMMSPNSHHSMILMNSWLQEVQEIRNSVFLIVDPVAFAEKSKQMMHQKLLEVLNENDYNNTVVCSVINVGSIVHDFFEAYEKYEPDALPQYKNLAPLLTDLRKVQKECKMVSNLLTSRDDFVYDVPTPQNQEVSFDQLIKRLKLLYTILNRIDNILRPKENDDQLFANEEEKCLNVTQTLYKGCDTYDVKSRKQINISRSIFARTTNVRSSTRNIPLGKLTKHLRSKKCNELSFSVQLDRLFNGSEAQLNHNETFFVNKNLCNLREQSILYNFSPIKNRSSLRKVVLNRHCVTQDKVLEGNERSILSERDSVMDETMNLEITEVLNQMHDITNIISTNKPSLYNCTRRIARENEPYNEDSKTINTNNVLSLSVNKDVTISKRVRKNPVNASVVPLDEIPLDESACTSNITQPSYVTTLERLSDLDLVESKISTLKTQFETSL